jgi:hypothetical protein
MRMLIHIQYVLQSQFIIYLLNVPSLNVKYMIIQRRNSLVLFLWMTGVPDTCMSCFIKTFIRDLILSLVQVQCVMLAYSLLIYGLFMT